MRQRGKFKTAKELRVRSISGSNLKAYHATIWTIEPTSLVIVASRGLVVLLCDAVVN